MVLFTLTGLNVDVGLYEFIEYPTYDFPDVSASYYLDLSINPIYFDNIFYFKTTDPELTSDTADNDMAFKCESSYWPDISFSEGVISNNVNSDIDNYLPPPSATGVHYNKNIGVQWLAKNITGGYNNSDLFANEGALVQQYVDLDKYNATSLIGEQTNISLAVKSDTTNYRYIRIIINSIHPYETRTQASISFLSLYSNIIYPQPTLTQQESDNRFNYISSFTTDHITTSPDFSADSDKRAYMNVVEYPFNMGGGHPVQYFGHGCYDAITGLVTDTAPYTGNIYGSWVQFDLGGVGLTTNDIKHIGMSFDKGSYGRNKGLNTYSNQGTTANKIIVVGSNDISANFNVLGTFYSSIKLTETSQWLYNHKAGDAESALNGYKYHMFRGTFESYSTIKHLITTTLDVSGGSDAAPLSNADTGRNNVAREALLHLLDNDISTNVQRVNNMIADASNNRTGDATDISAGDTSNLWIPIEFFDGDTIKFKLIYKPDQITNDSNVAIDDSGNALGTNPIEDQDYVVRLNIVGQRDT